MGQAATGSIFQGVGSVQQGKVGMASTGMAENASRLRLGESKVEVKSIEVAAAQREADRKEALERALSSTNAMAGASGIGLGGSPYAVMKEDIRQKDVAQERDTFMTDMEKRQKLYKANLARKFEKKQTAMGYFSTFHNTVASVGGAAGGASSGAQ